MEAPERRRNVSAPTLNTPAPLQTQGPPQVYQRLSTDSSAEDFRKYTLHFPSPQDRYVYDENDPLQNTILERVKRNLNQLISFLMVTIWADFLVLMSSYPCHTIYFLTTEAGRDILHALFELIWRMWYRTTSACKFIRNVLSFANLRYSARRFVETLEWWWTAWRYRVEAKGTAPLVSHPTLLGKGNGLSAWSSDTNPYWPFNSAESAFEYLDAEFSAPLTGIEPTFPTKINEDESVRLSKIIPTTVLKEYIEQKTQKYITASSEAETRKKINPILVRQLLRQLNNPQCAKDLDTFTADYSLVSMPLGYILDEVDKTPQWLHLIIGVGNFGLHMYTTVRCAQREIRGVALGMLHNSPHIVIVVPGRGGLSLPRSRG